VWFFLKNNWKVNKEIVKKRTSMPIQQLLKKCIEIVEGISNRGILSGIGELLDEKQKSWVKKTF
jgi:hypothetical protein